MLFFCFVLFLFFLLVFVVVVVVVAFFKILRNLRHSGRHSGPHNPAAKTKGAFEYSLCHPFLPVVPNRKSTVCLFKRQNVCCWYHTVRCSTRQYSRSPAFCIFINDLPLHIHDHKVGNSLFADDSSLHRRAVKLLLPDTKSSTDENLKALGILPLQKQLDFNKPVPMF